MYAIRSYYELSDFAGGRAIISVHNHNDLGLSTANTLAASYNFV